jgi:hypothetical protein
MMARLAFAEAAGPILKAYRRRERNPTNRTHPQAFQLLMNQEQRLYEPASLLEITLRINPFFTMLLY